MKFYKVIMFIVVFILVGSCSLADDLLIRFDSTMNTQIQKNISQIKARTIELNNYYDGIEFECEKLIETIKQNGILLDKIQNRFNIRINKPTTIRVEQPKGN